ncbi:TetR/AcrR family transcriptional regulator [Ketobacter sp.]|uniref:TetR/AcrR family transcriptional regulator n=1 Tax=Ketobacter sp. TaxID=2083498 RepID=UPI000F1450F0|nr:TetR/AcrR family transcriptional regulator [Ketobacter sp.]RLT93965.1 MAG: TetR/AcrR family transcriptional regulator [Ketobacter sp.]
MRKAPKQKRSREMVSRLLDATAATIARRGLDGTTTNHIADQAGVSIGSVYQYFPDKEALVESLLTRMGEQAGRRFRQQAKKVDIDTMNLQQVALSAIQFGIYSIRRDPLTYEMIRNWSRVPIHKLLDPLEQAFLVAAQPYFLKHYSNYPVHNLETKLYVVINSTIFTAIRYVIQDDSMIEEKELVATLSDMIVRTLEPVVH